MILRKFRRTHERHRSACGSGYLGNLRVFGGDEEIIKKGRLTGRFDSISNERFSAKKADVLPLDPLASSPCRDHPDEFGCAHVFWITFRMISAVFSVSGLTDGKLIPL